MYRSPTAAWYATTIVIVLGIMGCSRPETAVKESHTNRSEESASPAFVNRAAPLPRLKDTNSPPVFAAYTEWIGGAFFDGPKPSDATSDNLRIHLAIWEDGTTGVEVPGVEGSRGLTWKQLSMDDMQEVRRRILGNKRLWVQVPVTWRGPESGWSSLASTNDGARSQVTVPTLLLASSSKGAAGITNDSPAADLQSANPCIGNPSLEALICGHPA